MLHENNGETKRRVHEVYVDRFYADFQREIRFKIGTIYLIIAFMHYRTDNIYAMQKAN